MTGHEQIRRIWEDRIQTELIELTTSTSSQEADYHYRSHKVHLMSGTCYIWFSIHTKPEIVVLMDASMQAVEVKSQNQQKQVELYPHAPPRCQFVSGRLPRGSTVKLQQFMPWSWMQTDLATGWSAWDMQIRDAIQVVARTIRYHCDGNIPFPPTLKTKNSSGGGGLFACCFHLADKAVIISTPPEHPAKSTSTVATTTQSSIRSRLPDYEEEKEEIESLYD